jgi:hypothetical protein
VLSLAFSSCVCDTRPLSTTTSPSACAPITPRDLGLWVWQTSAITDPQTAQSLRTFAAAHHVRRLSLHAQGIADGSVAQRAQLAEFIRAAHAACIEVDLLFGATEWTAPGPNGQDAAVRLVDATIAFGVEHADTRPDGVEFDVEPYTTDAWNTDRQGTENDYLDLLERLGAAASRGRLRFGADVAFWYYSEPCTRDGITRPFGELVTDRVDRIEIMAYRDFAGVDHDNGIIDVASEEIAYASRAGREAIVGVETSPQAPDTQTFAQEGPDALARELEVTRVWFTSQPAFGAYRGNAVHDWHYFGAQYSLPQ